MLDKHFLTGFSKIQGHFLFVQNEKKKFGSLKFFRD